MSSCLIRPVDEASSSASGLSRDEAISLLRKSIETTGQKEFEEPTKFTFTQSSHRKIVNLESGDESAFLQDFLGFSA